MKEDRTIEKVFENLHEWQRTKSITVATRICELLTEFESGIDDGLETAAKELYGEMTIH